MGMGGVRVAVLAAVVGAFLAAGVTHAQPAMRLDLWLTSRADAMQRLKERFPNIGKVGCQPDPTRGSDVFGNVREWNRFSCGGTTRRGVQFTLTFSVTGQCKTCWLISNLKGTSVADLRRKSGQTSTPPAPASGGGGKNWYWSESSADDTLGHSLWVVRHSIDPYTVDCGGFGKTISGDSGGALYHTFRCRMNNAIVSNIWYLYRLTTTGRDTFTMVKLAQGYTPG